MELHIFFLHLGIILLAAHFLAEAVCAQMVLRQTRLGRGFPGGLLCRSPCE